MGYNALSPVYPGIVWASSPVYWFIPLWINQVPFQLSVASMFPYQGKSIDIYMYNQKLSANSNMALVPSLINDLCTLVLSSTPASLTLKAHK